jgi:hypothetical protein
LISVRNLLLWGIEGTPKVTLKYIFIFRSIMEKEDIKHVNCAHCGARVRLEDAVHFKSVFIYGEHYHCRDCDPEGKWDCMIDDVAMH